MKRTTTLIAALLIVMGTALANNPTDGAAKTQASVSLVKWKDQVHKLFYTGEEAGKVIIRVKDAKGTTLMRRTVQNKEGFALPLNFEKQGYGEYELFITDRNGTYSQEFIVAPAKKPCTCS